MGDGLRCNLDARGKSLRLVGGAIVGAIGVVLLIGAGIGALDSWGWFVGGSAFIVGAFMIFEGWSGWCVLRAMGFKTRV